MPGFSTWGDNSRRMTTPLTPPDYDTTYSRMAAQGCYASQTSQHRHGQLDQRFLKQHSQASNYPAQQGYTKRASAQMPMNLGHDFNAASTYSHHSSNRSFAPDVTAPILPPIQAQEALDPYAHYVPAAHVPVEQKPKEEKATGGVAVHLDYDMGTMSDFVAEMSQGIVNSNVHVTAQYRKYVSQILSSTRLPSSTIMLGLFYLANRMKIMSARDEQPRSSGSVYRMLTTCLLLGSKFLDDNTFQNRSWAEVSSIPVTELNQMELDWLKDFEWSIHGRMYDPNEGFFMWREHWLAYEDDTKARKMKEVQQLAPINTVIRRQQSTRKPMMSPEGPIPAQYQRNSQYDTQWVSPLISEPSPPSAAYSGPATPEYYNPSWSYGRPSGYSTQMWTQSASTPVYVSSRSQPQSYHQASFMQQYPPAMWNNSCHACGCSVYGKCKDHYFLQSNPYNMQTVAC